MFTTASGEKLFFIVDAHTVFGVGWSKQKRDTGEAIAVVSASASEEGKAMRFGVADIQCSKVASVLFDRLLNATDGSACTP